MGSASDWEVMAAAAETLEAFGIPYEKRVVSAHRTPDLLVEYAKTARGRGIEVIIACLLYTSPSPRDRATSRMPSSA